MVTNFGQVEILNKILMPKYLLAFFIAILIPFKAVKASPQVVHFCFLDIGFGKFTNKTLTGIWQRKIIHSLEKTGAKIHVTFAPRERCLNSLLLNQVDAIVAGYSHERSLIGVFPTNVGSSKVDSSKRVGQVNYSIYKLKSSLIDWDGQNFYNLTTKKIGTQRGINTKHILNKAGISDFEEVNSISQGITKVAYGRNEIFIGEEYQSDLALKELHITAVTKISKPFYQDNVYVLFSKQFFQKNEKFSKKFWNKIEKVRNSNEYTDTTPVEFINHLSYNQR